MGAIHYSSALNSVTKHLAAYADRDGDPDEAVQVPSAM